MPVVLLYCTYTIPDILNFLYSYWSHSHSATFPSQPTNNALINHLTKKSTHFVSNPPLPNFSAELRCSLTHSLTRVRLTKRGRGFSGNSASNALAAAAAAKRIRGWRSDVILRCDGLSFSTQKEAVGQISVKWQNPQKKKKKPVIFRVNIYVYIYISDPVANLGFFFFLPYLQNLTCADDGVYTEYFMQIKKKGFLYFYIFIM